jgi:hypothetical protein
MIDDFQVLPQHLFPVHSFLRISFCIPVGCRTVDKCIMPTNLTETFNRCSSSYTDEDSDNEKARKRESQMHEFHYNLDSKLKRLADRFHGLLQHQDTDRYWALWNNAIEEAFCEQFVPDHAERKRYKGGGQHCIKKRHLDKVKQHSLDDNKSEDAMGELGNYHSMSLAKANRQQQRLNQWHARLKMSIGKHGYKDATTIAAIANSRDAILNATYAKLNAEACKSIIANLDSQNDAEQDF